MKKRLFIKVLFFIPLFFGYFGTKEIQIKKNKIFVKKSNNLYWVLSKEDY